MNPVFLQSCLFKYVIKIYYNYKTEKHFFHPFRRQTLNLFSVYNTVAPVVLMQRRQRFMFSGGSVRVRS